MSSYQKVRIAERATVLMGQSPPSSTCSESGDGLPFIQGNAEFGPRHPLPRLRCSAPTRIAEAGDLLLSVRAPVGELNQATTRTVIGRGLSAIRFAADDQGFAWHAVEWSSGALNQIAQGSTFVAVGRQDVENLEIPWHADANRRIAAVLDTVDEAIAKTEVVIAKLQQVRAGLLHDLLTRGLDEHGQLRDPIAHPEQFQDSPLGRIPRIWITKPLHQAAKVIDSLHRTPGFSVEGLPMVRVTDIKGGYLQLSECARVEPQVYEEFTTNHKPRRGDIVLSRVGSYGISSLADTDEPFCMGQNTVIVTEHSNPRFLHEVLQSEPLRRQFEFAVAGSSQKTLSLRAIREALIPDPPTEEQARIADLLQAFTSQSAEEMAFLAKLGKLKSGLMADLLTGRVRVPEESPVAP
jgi:type I restriction enzyme, S subunit